MSDLHNGHGKRLVFLCFLARNFVI